MPPVVEPMVMVVLVAALDLLVTEHQGHLVAGEGVEAAMADQGFRPAGAGDDDAAFELLHILASLLVMMRRMSASVQ